MLLTYCAQCSFTSNGVWHFTELIGAQTLKNSFVPALEVNFLKKLPHLVDLQIFEADISDKGNHWTIIFCHIIIGLILIIFFKTQSIYVTKKDTKFGSQNFGYQIWFCTRLLIQGSVSGIGEMETDNPSHWKISDIGNFSRLVLLYNLQLLI